MIKDVTFEGLKAIELSTGALKLIAVHEIGPRIAFLGKNNGDNLFFWDSPSALSRGDWYLRGGHRVWIARPGADEAEETYSPDNAPCDVETFDNGFKLTAPVDPSNNTRRGFAIKTLTDDTIEVEQFISNVGDMLFSASIWGLTCSLPAAGTRYGFPIGDESKFDAFKLVMFRKWAGHGAVGFNDPQFTFTEDMMWLDPRGVENKRMLQAHRGAQAMIDPSRGVVFAKKASYDPCKSYPLDTNQAVYVGPDNFMVEMETMSEEVTIKPDQTFSTKEIWTVKPFANIASMADCLALF